MNTEKDRSSRSFRSVRALRLAVFLVVATGVAIGARLYTSLVDPERVRLLAEDYMQEFAGGRVSVGSASLSWFGGVRLTDVVVSAAPQDHSPRDSSAQHSSLKHRSGSSAPALRNIFRCRQIDLYYDRWSMLRGQFKISSVIAHEPTCVIIRNATDGTTNLAGLLQTRLRNGDRRPIQIPPVEFRGARITVLHQDDQLERFVQELRITVRAVPVAHRKNTYDIAWRSDQPDGASGRARLDVTAGRLRNISGGLPWVSLEAVMIAVNAGFEEAGMWSDLLDLSGRMRVHDYDLAIGGDAAATQTATVLLEDAALSIPINEHEQSLPAAQRYLRFERVYGTIDVTADRLVVDFNGVLHGAPCRVTAEFRGGVDSFSNLSDVGFDACVAATELRMPRIDDGAPEAERRFVRHFGAMRKFYRNFDPHGPLDVDLEVHKAFGADKPVELQRMVLTADGCDVQCRWFPYRIKDINGQVEFTPAGVRLLDLRGQHNGGAVVGNGWMESPKAWSAAEINIVAKNLPLDDALYAALPARFSGVRRRLQPEGSVDADILLIRKEGQPGEKPPFFASCLVNLTGADACYADFPYPIQEATGDVLWDGSDIQLLGIAARTAETSIDIEGFVRLGRGDVQELAIDLTAIDVLFDDTLRAALPDALRDRLDKLRPTGSCDVSSRIEKDSETAPLRHDTRVVVQNARIQPTALPVTVTDVSGVLDMVGDQVRLHDISGKYGGGLVTVSGTIELGGGGAGGAIAVNVRCEDVPVDARLQDALPRAMRRALGSWRVEGPLTIETSITRPSRSCPATPTIQTTVKLHGAKVTHPSLPLPLTDVYGTVTVDAAGLKTTGITAAYGTAPLELVAHAQRFGEELAVTASLSAKDLNLDENVRLLLPEQVQRAWEPGQVTGVVDVDFERLYYHGTHGVGDLEVAGRINLRGVGVAGPTPVQSLTGTMTVNGILLDRLGGTTVGGSLDITSGTVLARATQGIQAQWSLIRVADGEARLTLDDVQAFTCGGLMTARVELNTQSASSNYNLNAVFHDIDLSQFLAAGRSPGRDDDDHKVTRGRARASLYLTGVLNDPLSKRGGGQVEVRDGNLYRLPIMLAILNVINLTIPDDAVDDARAEFYVLGNRVEFPKIALQGDTVALTGWGSMSLPDQGVDLYLVSVNPAAQKRLPALASFVEAASRELVELHVSGPLTSPTVVAKPLRGINEELKRLFRKKPPKRLRPTQGLSRN